MSEKKEILERVLLLMKYDNRITLSENYTVLAEQLSTDSIINQGIDVNNTDGKNKQKFNDFLYSISSSNLKDLNKILSGINSKMRGINKLDIASSIVANEIYYKNLEDYYTKKEKGEDYTYQYGKKTRITKPEKPVLGDVRLAPYAESATEILQRYKSATEKKNKEKEQQDLKKGIVSKNRCPFDNKKDADEFRIWINKKYPKIAKQYDLSIKGPECNINILNASAHLFYIEDTLVSSKSVWEYEKEGTDISKKIQDEKESEYKSGIENKSKQMRAEFTVSDKNGIFSQSDVDNYGELINNFIDTQISKLTNITEFRNKETGIVETRWNISELKDEDYNITIYTNRVVKFNLGNYEKEGYSRSKTVDLLEAKSKEQIAKDYFEELKKMNEKLQLKSVISDILDSANFQRIYGTDDKSKKFIEDKIKECGDSARNYFEELSAGQIRNSRGKVVGSLENGVVIRPDSNKIPCTNEFWEKYGGYIQIGTIVGAAILSAGLSLGPTAAFILEATVDTAVNYYALKKSVEKGDKSEIKMNLAYLMLPFLMRAPIVKQGLARLKYGSETIASVESKLNSLRPNATKSEINAVINGMSNQEKAVLTGLQKPAMKKAIQTATQETIQGLKAGTEAAQVSGLPEHLVNLFVYTAPVGKNLLDNISEIKEKYRKQLQRQPSNIELKVWAAVKEKLRQQNEEDLLNQLMNTPEFKKVVESKQMENAKKTVSGFEGKKPEEVKQQLEGVNRKINDLIIFMKSNLNSQSDKNIPTVKDNNKDLELQKTQTDSTSQKKIDPFAIN